jgi:hypothetical protein
VYLSLDLFPFFAKKGLDDIYHIKPMLAIAF